MASLRTDLLGMNARNLSYILRQNSAASIRLADNKLATKKLLRRFGIPTPRLLAALHSPYEAETFAWHTLPESFVIKPNAGLGGEGIVVLRSRIPDASLSGNTAQPAWKAVDGSRWDVGALRAHVANILSGNFSIAGTSDSALIEQRIERHPLFRRISPGGVPDIRILVFNKVPVMAMLRLPTTRSNGKANLAQGAVGVGLNIATGHSTHALTKKPHRSVDTHPDTGAPLSEITIPFWNDVLAMSVDAQVVSGLGYAGVDIAIDRTYGPMVVEMNARPGLEIQTVNVAPLQARLRRVQGLRVRTVRKGVSVGKELFGGEGEVPEEGRPVLGIVEPVEIFSRDKTHSFKLLAKIDTGAKFTSIDRDLIEKLGYTDAVAAFREHKLERVLTPREARRQHRKFQTAVLARPGGEIIGADIIHSSHGTTLRVAIPTEFTLGGRRVRSRSTVVIRKHLQYPIIVGQRDLAHFLVDPARKRDHLQSFAR